MTRKKIVAFVGATALAIALSGCGGGGTTTPAPDPEPMPTPIETAAGNLAMAVGAQAALGAGASDTMRRDAAQAVATAAAAYLALLQADAGSSHAEVARVQGLLSTAQTTVMQTQAAIDHANTLGTASGALATAQMTLADATDAAARLAAANAVIDAADAYLALLNADPTTPHTEITRVEGERQSARTARDMAQMDIDDAEDARMAMEALDTARGALTQAKANFATVDAAAASSAQDRVNAANAVLEAAEALAALDPSEQSEVDAAQGAVDMAQAVRDVEIADDTAAQARATARDALADARTAAARVNGSATATNVERRNAAQEVVNKAMELHALLESQDRSFSEVDAASDELNAARMDLMMAQAQVDADEAAARREAALATAMTRLDVAKQAVDNLAADATEEQQRVALEEQLNAANAIKDMLDPDTTPATVYNQAEDDVEIAQMAFDAIETAIAERATAVTAATMRLEAARLVVAALPELTDESTAAEKMTAQAAQAELRDAAMALNEARETPDADVAAEYEAAKMAAADLQTEIAADAAAVKVVADTKAAGTKKTAIAAEASQGPNQSPLNNDAGLGGSADDGTAVDTYTLTISRDRDGTTMKIVDTAQMGDDDPMFEPSNGMLVRTQEANDDGDVVQEVVMVRTDIEAPKGVAFAMFEVIEPDGTSTTPQALDVMKDDGAAPDADETADALNVDQTEADVLELVMSPAFGAPGDGSSSVQRTFLPATEDADTITPGNQPRDAAEVDGTYNGAMGSYVCAGTGDCTVTVDDDGDVTAMSDGWVFVPATGATTDQPDYDYLHYGFWLKRTTDKDGVVTYNEVETFAGARLNASGDVSAVEGSATYSGGATGVYVHSVIKPDGSEASATSGHFTADAELAAYFGGDDVAPSNVDSISGTIDNFMLSGHDEGPGWSVSLEKDDDISDGTFSGIAKGGGADGSYSGTFHGTVGADTQPHTAVGEFNANFSNGTVAGAFGTRIEEDDE